MSTIEKVSIALSSELLTMIREVVAGGQYASTSEVIREALREWRLRQSIRDAHIEQLKSAWHQGLIGGKSVPLDMTALKSRARKALKERE